MLGKLLGIHPGEWKRFLFFFHLTLVLAIGITFGATAALSLFIKRYGVDYLPHMFMLTAAVALIVTPVYNNFLGKISNEKYFLIILGLSILSIIAIRCFANSGAGPIFLVLYVCYSIIAWLCYSHTFIIAYEYFDTQEAKRLFPLIVSGISLGGILGGLGVKLLMKFLGTVNLLEVWAVFMVLAGVVTALLRICRVEKVAAAAHAKKKSSLGFFGNLSADFREMMKFPMVRALVFSTAITNAFFIADYLSSKVFAHSFADEAKLTAFLGVFTAVSSLIGLVIQMGILSRLLSRIGVANANMIYSGSMLAGFASLAAWPMLPAACLGFFNRRYLSYAVGEPVERLMYNSLPAQMKGRAAAFIKGYIEPVSTVAVCLIIMGVNAIFAGTSGTAFAILAVLGVAVSGANLWQRYSIKRLYTASFVSMISERNIDLKALAEGLEKGRENELENIPFDEYIESDDEALYAMILEFIGTSRIKKFAEKLITVFHDKSHDMQIDTLKTIASVDGVGQAEFFLELVRGPRHTDVRALCIRLLGDLKNDDVYDGLVEFLGDPDENVQSAAIAAICRSGDIFHMSQALGMLNDMLKSADENRFLRGVRILADIGDRRAIKNFTTLLEGRTERVRGKIITAICSLETGEDDRYLGYFHELLGKEKSVLCGQILDTVKKIASEKSAPALAAVINGLNSTNRLKAVAALGAIGGSAQDLLISILKDCKQPHSVRTACLEELDRFPSKNISSALDDVGAEQIRHVYSTVDLRDKIDGMGGHSEYLDFVVGEMLQKNVGLWLQIIARKSRKPSEVSMLIEPLFDREAASRASALETLENLIDKNCYRMIFPIFDKVPDKDRLAAAGKLMEIVKLPLPELYQWVMKHAPAWYYSCLLFSLKSVPGAYGNDDMSDVIEEGFANGAPECMEAALIAAAECGLTSRFNVTCASLTASHIEQLRVAAVRAINPDEKGADVMLSTFEKIMFLKKVAIFSNLDSHALKILSGISCVAACAKGEIIFEEGEFGDAMYIIRAGAVRLYLRGNQAKPLAVLKESQYFGEMAVLAGEPRSATAAADTDCTLIRIQRDHFIELIREYPLITLPIFKALTHRIREMQK